MRSINLIAALAATATLGVAATAEADTYCVGSPASCPAGAPGFGNLDPALKAAEDHDGPDVIRIGTGTFKTATGFLYNTSKEPGNGVEIIGEGAGTVLRADKDAVSAHMGVLGVNSAGKSKVANLKIVAPDRTAAAVSVRGLAVIGDVAVEGVSVTDSGATTLGATEGIEFRGASIVGSSVTMNDQARAIGLDTPNPASIVDVRLTGKTGIWAESGASFVVRRASIRARAAGIAMKTGTVAVESSVVQITGEEGDALRADGAATGAAALKASHVTLVGSGSGDPDHAGIDGMTTNDGDVSFSIDNSIIQGFTRGTRRKSTDVGGQGEVTIVGANVNYDAANDYSEGSGDTKIEPTLNLKPVFLDPAAGDFRLKKASQMIDAGRVATYVALTSTDLAGKARTIGTRRDLGAYEYQDAAPVAKIAGPLEVEPGQPLALSGASSEDPDGEGVATWQWTLGDGRQASGADIAPSWDQPGTYEVALSVTDVTGKSGSASVTVVVAAKPVVVTEEPPKKQPEVVNPPADLTAPVISALSRKGRTLRFSLSEAAAVKVLITKRGKGRKFRPAGNAKRAAGVAGANGVQLRKLRRGSYRVVVTATDAAGNSAVKRLAFRVAR